MKHIIKSVYLTLLFSVLSLSVFSQGGSVSINQSYSTGLYTVVTIDIKEAKAVRINYSIDITQGSDNLIFYDINSSGGQNTTGVTPTGYTTGTYITSTKTGKAVINLYCGTAGTKKIDLQYSADNSITTSSDLTVGGNTIITGRLGVGTSSTTKKVELWDNSASRFTFSGASCSSGYEIASTIDNTGYKINVGSSIRDYRVAIAGTDRFIISYNGYVAIGGTNKFQLVDWANQTSWLDIPVVTGKASGIGSGGAGANAWIGYAGVAGQWFTNSSGGDICYRNKSGKLLFGNTDGNSAMAINNNNVGINTTTPNAKLEIVSGINAYPATANATQTGGALRLRGGDNAVLDFGMNSINTWLQATDQYNLGLNYNISLNPNGGNVGIGTGTSAPQARLDVRGDIQLRNSDKIGCSVLTDQFQYDNKYSGNYSISWVNDSWTSTGTTMWQSAWGGMKFFTNGTPRLSITNAGKVGIGTSAPDEFLTVKGKIHAEEVIVDLNVPVADYVFGKEYKLMPLHKVEEYVNANSHLPEVPSAAEIKEKGLSMGEMQNKLLQKVEELTLYVIQQQKEIESLKKQLGKTPNP